MTRKVAFLLLIVIPLMGTALAEVPPCHVWIERTKLHPLPLIRDEQLVCFARTRLKASEAEAARALVRRVLEELGRDPEHYDAEAAVEDWRRGAPFLRLRPRVPELPLLRVYCLGHDSRGCMVVDVLWDTKRPWEVGEFLPVGEALWKHERYRMQGQLEYVEESLCRKLVPESCERLRQYWQTVSESYVPEAFKYAVYDRPGYCAVIMWERAMKEPLRDAEGPVFSLDGPLGHPLYVRKDAAGHCSPEIMEEAGAAGDGGNPGGK